MSAAIKEKYMVSIAIAAAVTFGFGILATQLANATPTTTEPEDPIEEGMVGLDSDFVSSVEESPVAVVDTGELDLSAMPDEVIDNGTSETVIYSGNDASVSLDEEGLDGLGDSEEIVVVAAGATENVYSDDIDGATVVSGNDAVVTVTDDGVDGLGDSEFIIAE